MYEPNFLAMKKIFEINVVLNFIFIVNLLLIYLICFIPLKVLLEFSLITILFPNFFMLNYFPLLFVSL